MRDSRIPRPAGSTFLLTYDLDVSRFGDTGAAIIGLLDFIDRAREEPGMPLTNRQTILARLAGRHGRNRVDEAIRCLEENGVITKHEFRSHGNFRRHVEYSLNYTAVVAEAPSKCEGSTPRPTAAAKPPLHLADIPPPLREQVQALVSAREDAQRWIDLLAARLQRADVPPVSLPLVWLRKLMQSPMAADLTPAGEVEARRAAGLEEATRSAAAQLEQSAREAEREAEVLRAEALLQQLSDPELSALAEQAIAQLPSLMKQSIRDRLRSAVRARELGTGPVRAAILKALPRSTASEPYRAADGPEEGMSA